jgi:hypothetical protein
MSLATLLCLLAIGFVVYNVDPFQDTGVGLSFFYLSVFFFLLGVVSMLSFVCRYFWSKLDEPMFKLVKRSFRDGFVTSLILICLLFLQGQGYLRWWNVGIFAAAVILVLLFRIFNKPIK